MRYNQTLIAIIAILTFVSCVKPESVKPIERVQYQMGTYARVQIVNGNNDDVNAAFSKIKELDNLLSDYNPDSEISEINKMAGIRPVKVDPQVIRVLEIAKTVATETNGVFDPSIGSLTIGVYRFGREREVEIDISDIDKAKALVNYRDLKINDDHVYLDKKGMMIDLGGIGKGFAVERAVDALKQRGVSDGVVSLSGDIKVFGERQEIAITNPGQQGSIATFNTGGNELAISTSGSYERSVNIDGKVYHHLIVPETGKPGSDFLSLSVVIDGSSTFADAYATALFVMGRERALEFLNTHKEIGVFMVFSDRSIYYNQTFISLVDSLNVQPNEL